MSKVSLTLSVPSEFREFIFYLSERENKRVGEKVVELCNLKFLKSPEITNLFFSEDSDIKEILEVWERTFPSLIMIEDEDRVKIGKNSYLFKDLKKDEIFLKNLVYNAIDKSKKKEEKSTLDKELNDLKLHPFEKGNGEVELVPERGSKIKKVLKCRKKDILKTIKGYLEKKEVESEK